MSEERLKLILRTLNPKENAWFGGPTPAGSLRDVGLDRALQKAPGISHSIWELALHVAYWEYAVRRILEGSPQRRFERTPSNWPSPPPCPTEDLWHADRRLLLAERKRLVEAIRGFDPLQLDGRASDRSKHSVADLLMGVVQHSVYHTAQITVLKRAFAATAGSTSSSLRSSDTGKGGQE